MEENKTSKTKSLSITIILLAIVVGFGFLVGLAQITGGSGSTLPPDSNPEISNYYFDDEGRFLGYFSDDSNWNIDVNIPKTYSLTETKVDMQKESTSISELVEMATRLKLDTFTITDISYYEQNGSYQYYRTKYKMDFKFRKTYTGNQYTTTIIGKDIFRNTVRYRSFTIPDTVKTVEYGAFCGAHGHTEMIFPEGVETLEGAVCFSDSSLKTVSLPSTLKYIGAQAFEQCNQIEEIVLPDSVETISGNSFSQMNKLKTITLSKSLSFIAGYSISYNPNLTTINFKEGNYTIGERAFQNCSALTEVNLPTTLTTINARAFEGCSSLSRVILNANSVVEIKSNSFPANVEKFYVRDELYNQYLESAAWTGLTDKIAKISEL